MHSHHRFCNYYKTLNSDAIDPRDKIYGMLGLSLDFSSGPELVPDCNLTTREVSTSIVKAHMKKYDDLGIFGHCG
jgi:hypothetical protein